MHFPLLIPIPIISLSLSSICFALHRNSRLHQISKALNWSADFEMGIYLPSWLGYSEMYSSY